MITFEAIHKVRTLKQDRYLTPLPHCSHFNKRVTSLKQQLYTLGKTLPPHLPVYVLSESPLLQNVVKLENQVCPLKRINVFSKQLPSIK